MFKQDVLRHKSTVLVCGSSVHKQSLAKDEGDYKLSNPARRVQIKKQASPHLPRPISAAGVDGETTAGDGGASWRLLPARPNSLD